MSVSVVAEPPVSLRPGDYFVPLPDLAHFEHDLWRGEIVPRDELLNALAADSEHAADLCRTHEVMHGRKHRHLTASHLTIPSHATSVSHMSTTAQPQPTRCLRPGCGRVLRAPASVKAGYGPVCRAKIRAAALAEALRDFTAAQIEKARELIEMGGLVPVRPGIFRTVSSQGDETYLTAATGQCNCPAGLRGRRCYHGAAARTLAASGKAA